MKPRSNAPKSRSGFFTLFQGIPLLYRRLNDAESINRLTSYMIDGGVDPTEDRAMADERKDKATPQQVIEKITKQSRNTDLTPHLKRMFESSKRRQEGQGVRFDLTFDDYLSLITPGRRRIMQRELNRGNLRGFMESNLGYVLTPKGRSEKAGMVCNKETFEFTNRRKSKENQHLKKGDRHRDDSKAKIAVSRTGKTHTEETKEKIREANKGQVRSDETRANIAKAKLGTTDSEETKNRKSEAAKARHARRRAEKEAQANGQ